VKITDWIDGVALVLLGASIGVMAGALAFVFRFLLRRGRRG
jgi:hypothetical protein